jgi:hypothetical protein
MMAHTAVAAENVNCHDLESAATANDFTGANTDADKNLICVLASVILSRPDRDD